MPFSKLGLSPAILEGVKAMGYVEPTPIQLRAIPLVLAGTRRHRQRADRHRQNRRVRPAHPVETRRSTTPRPARAHPRTDARTRRAGGNRLPRFRALHQFENHRRLSAASVTARQNGRLAAPARTSSSPRRDGCSTIWNSGTLRLGQGPISRARRSRPDARHGISARRAPHRRKMPARSATPRCFPPPFRRRSKRSSNGRCTIPRRSRSARAARRPKRSSTSFIPLPIRRRSDLLLELLERVNYDSVLIFCRTKHGADRIAGTAQAQQSRRGRAAFQPHPDANANRRCKGFRDGKFEVLVATDIAARGLDIADVSHVINYDVPQHPEDYIHRIGRTGRAEATGDAFTIMIAEDAAHVFAIERFISQKIPRVKLENFDYKLHRAVRGRQARPARRFPRQSPRRPRPRRLPFRARRTEKVNFRGKGRKVATGEAAQISYWLLCKMTHQPDSCEENNPPLRYCNE